MTHDITDDGTIFFGDTKVGKVFYWLTLTEEIGPLVAEGCISGSEEFMDRIAKTQQVRLQLENGPIFSLVTDGGATGSRWVRLFKI